MAEEKTTKENKELSCTICNKDMSNNYTGIVRFVKGKPVCNNCYEILQTGVVEEETKSNAKTDIV